ncbi:hypothetical protein AAHC03_016709 [Spirometra sp. Aus1]
MPVETSLTIHILDVNDNPPIFVNTPYVFTVSETAPIGHKVGQVEAKDADDTSTLAYLLQGIVLDFAVNSVTGVITVARRLDYVSQEVCHPTPSSKIFAEPVGCYLQSVGKIPMGACVGGQQCHHGGVD